MKKIKYKLNERECSVTKCPYFPDKVVAGMWCYSKCQYFNGYNAVNKFVKCNHE